MIEKPIMNADKLKEMIVVAVAWLIVAGLLYACYLKLKILFH
jgi:hypothetical protein